MIVSDLGGVLDWRPEGTPYFVYGFCNLEKLPAAIPGVREYDRLRSHTNHPAVVGRGGYSTARTASLGDPCDRLRERGLLDQVGVTPRSWQAVAVGNLDDDPDLEIWTIDESRTLTRLATD